jgi:hypothetical protein
MASLEAATERNKIAQRGAEAFWRYEPDVTPAREARSTDVRALSFPMQIVVAIVTATVIGSGAVWAVTSGLRSDVRDILTRMQMQDEVSKSQRQLQDERMKSLGEQVQDLKRRVELMQYEVQNQTKRSAK